MSGKPWTTDMVYNLLDQMAERGAVRVRKLATEPKVYEMTCTRAGKVERLSIKVED